MLHSKNGIPHSYDSAGCGFTDQPLVSHTAGTCVTYIMAHPGIVLWPHARRRLPNTDLWMILGWPAAMPPPYSCWPPGDELGQMCLGPLSVVP